MGVAAHPLVQVPHHQKAAVVGLAGFGGVHPGEPRRLKVYAVLILDRVAVDEHTHAAVVLHKDGKGFPGGLHRHQAVHQTDRFGGMALGGIGIAAVHCRQRVAAQIPDSGAVGGDGITQAGQLCHHRRQIAQRTAGGGHDDHAVRHSVGDGLLGAGGDAAGVVQQGAVQIQRGKADGGNILQHKCSFLTKRRNCGKISRPFLIL